MEFSTFVIATQTKTTEILRISSELCPLIHDRNRVWSAVKIAKDRGKQAFDGLRTLVVSVTRSHIFEQNISGKFIAAILRKVDESMEVG